MPNINALKILGFSPEVYDTLENIVQQGDGLWKMSIAREVCNQDEGKIKLVRLLYNLLNQGDASNTLDRIVEEIYGKSFDEFPSEEVKRISRHLKTMYNDFSIGRTPITNQDFYDIPEKVTHIPAYAELRKLEGIFSIYNHYLENGEPQYRSFNKIYFNLIKRGSQASIIETKTRPLVEADEDIKTKQAEIIIPEDATDNSIHIKVQNQFIGMQNRWVLILSTKQPKFVDEDLNQNKKYGFCKLYVMICGGGTPIYLYARETDEVDFDKKLGYYDGGSTILSYGHTVEELEKSINYYKKLLTEKRHILMCEIKKINEYGETETQKKVLDYNIEYKKIKAVNPKMSHKDVLVELTKKYPIKYHYDFGKFDVRMWFEIMANKQFEEKTNWFAELDEEM